MKTIVLITVRGRRNPGGPAAQGGISSIPRSSSGGHQTHTHLRPAPDRLGNFIKRGAGGSVCLGFCTKTILAISHKGRMGQVLRMMKEIVHEWLLFYYFISAGIFCLLRACIYVEIQQLHTAPNQKAIAFHHVLVLNLTRYTHRTFLVSRIRSPRRASRSLHAESIPAEASWNVRQEKEHGLKLLT
jgi:hypothetical protein